LETKNLWGHRFESAEVRPIQKVSIRGHDSMQETIDDSERDEGRRYDEETGKDVGMGGFAKAKL